MKNSPSDRTETRYKFEQSYMIQIPRNICKHVAFLHASKLWWNNDNDYDDKNIKENQIIIHNDNDNNRSIYTK